MTLVGRMCKKAVDEEMNNRLDVVSETYNKGKIGKPVRGISQLKYIMAKYNNEDASCVNDILEKLNQTLGIRTNTGTNSSSSNTKSGVLSLGREDDVANEIVKLAESNGDIFFKGFKSFLANDNNNLLVRIAFIDEKGEPNIVPTAYYFDNISGKIYLATHKASKKVNILRKNNVIAFSIDDPSPPYKGIRGKGKVKIHEDVSHSIPIAKKWLLKVNGSSIGHPHAKWLLSEIEKGNELVLEITPRYYSTWLSAIPT